MYMLTVSWRKCVHAVVGGRAKKVVRANFSPEACATFRQIHQQIYRGIRQKRAYHLTHVSSRHQAFSVSSTGASFLVRGRCMAEMSRAQTKPITAQSAENSQVVLNASITGTC